MSITTPKSSDQITVGSIETMHDQTRAMVNDLAPTNIGRSSINTDHLGSATLVQAAGSTHDLEDNISAEVSSYGGSNYGLAYPSHAALLAEITSWDDVATATISATTIRNGSPMIINFSSNVAKFLDSSSAEVVTTEKFMVWFAILIERTSILTGSSTNIAIEEALVGVHLQESIVYLNDSSADENRIGGINHAVSYTAMHETSGSNTYSTIKLKAAVCPCDSTLVGGASNKKVKLESSYLNFIILEPGS
jgi:hypothetical protein